MTLSIRTPELLNFRIGDVRDYPSLLAAMREADIVFHAAALKQVPSCEYFPFEAVQTNIIGAANLRREYTRKRPWEEKVIGISTDKACKPINVMGMTKALQERVLIEANRDCPETSFIASDMATSSRLADPSCLCLSTGKEGAGLDGNTARNDQIPVKPRPGVDTVFAAVRRSSGEHLSQRCLPQGFRCCQSTDGRRNCRSPLPVYAPAKRCTR